MTRPRPMEPALISTKLASAFQRLRGSGSALNSLWWRTISPRRTAAMTTPMTECRYVNCATAPAGSRTTAARQARRLRRLRPWASRRSRTPALMARAAANGPSEPGSTSVTAWNRLCRNRGNTPAATSRRPTIMTAVPTRPGTDSGRGPRKIRRTCFGTCPDLSPSILLDIASRCSARDHVAEGRDSLRSVVRPLGRHRGRAGSLFRRENLVLPSESRLTAHGSHQ